MTYIFAIAIAYLNYRGVHTIKTMNTTMLNVSCRKFQT